MTLDRSSMSVNRERAWPSYPPNHHERIRRKKTSRSGSSQRGAGPWKEDWKKGNGWATDRPRLGARMPASWTGILPCNQYPLFFVPQPTPSARRPAQATRRATGRRIPCASQVREAPWVVAAAHECCGFPPLWHMGPGGTGPSNFRSRRVRVGSVAFHSIVGTGSFCGVSRPGWNPALHWAMSSGEQPVRSFVEGRSGVVGPRVGCRSSTAPASWRTPNASRVRRRRADMKGRVPPRPWARVEPGSSVGDGIRRCQGWRRCRSKASRSVPVKQQPSPFYAGQLTLQNQSAWVLRSLPRSRVKAGPAARR